MSVYFEFLYNHKTEMQPLIGTYSDRLKRPIYANTQLKYFDSASCAHIQKLYYIEAAKDTVMILSETELNSLIELYSSQECEKGNVKMPFLSQFSYAFKNEMDIKIM